MGEFIMDLVIFPGGGWLVIVSEAPKIVFLGADKMAQWSKCFPQKCED